MQVFWREYPEACRALKPSVSLMETHSIDCSARRTPYRAANGRVSCASVAETPRENQMLTSNSRRAALAGFALSLLVMGASADPEAAFYPTTLLEPIGGLPESYGVAVAGNRVAGYSYRPTDQERTATLWENGRGISLEPPGSSLSIVADMNLRGSVVIITGFEGSYVSDIVGSSRRLRRLKAPKRIRTLNPRGINEKGEVCGFVEDRDSGIPTAVFWARNGKFTKLKNLPGGKSSAALDLNQKGLVVGNATDAQNVVRAVTWDMKKKGKIKQLPLLAAGVTEQRAQGVNDSGVIVGFAMAAGTKSAVRWAPNTAPEDLGNLGVLRANAFRVNLGGRIAGEAQGLDGPMHAVLFDPEAGIVDLNAKANPALQSRYFQALGLDDQSRITGYAVRGTNRVAYVMTVPASL